jgi:class 3 adenylate cyclase/CHASE2 domain-containing sensor protein
MKGGLALGVLGAAIWFGAEAPARVIAALVPTLGFPMAALLVRALAVLLMVAGLFWLRGALWAVAGRTFGAIDRIDARLDGLPPMRARATRALATGLTVGLAVIALVELTHADGYLETRVLDLFFRQRFPERSQVELATGLELPSANKQPEVVVLALDDETITHVGWPMPRIHYARLIDAVSAAHPASLTFDVSLQDPGRDHPEWDVAIGDAAARAGNVGFSFTVSRLGANTRPSLTEVGLRALDANSLPWDDRASTLPDYSELVGGDAAPSPVIDPISGKAHLVAMANVLLDGGDDVLRHSLLVARLGKRLLPSLSLRVAAQALDVPLDQIHVLPGIEVDLGGKRHVPIDVLGRTLVRYQGRHDTHGEGPFQYVSIWSLIRTDSTVRLTDNPMGDDQRFVLDDQTVVRRDGIPSSLAEVTLATGTVVSGKARYSPAPGRILELDVNTNAPPGEPDFELIDEQNLRFTTTLAALEASRGSAAALAGKHVLVGSTALAAADLRNSPLGELPGVEHHATMLANLLHGDFFTPAPASARAGLVVIAAMVAAVVGVAVTPGVGVLLTALLLLGLWTTTFLLSSKGIYVPTVGPTAAVATTWLASLVLGARGNRRAQARSEEQRDFVRRTFGRYLTEQVVQQLLDSPDGLVLGGQRDFVTIMMTDLRGFTSMCGTMQPEDVVRLLNHYLEAMTRIINRYGGTIDEFIGDAILVVFGAPLKLEHAEARAVACAIEMLNAMPAVNRWNTENSLPNVEMGIGIHSGEVVLGNIGSELRAKYGIVGATINLTSRVESYTVGGQVLISDETRTRGGDRLLVGTSQVVSPKGVKGTMTIHEALGVAAPFEVRLDSAAEDLVTPAFPLELRFGTVVNKQVAEVVNVAYVEALSDKGLELRVDQPLSVLADLQLRVFEGGVLKPGDVYGKILKAEVRPNVVYLRLTSVPPEVKPLFERARGGKNEAAPVADSALVSA